MKFYIHPSTQFKKAGARDERDGAVIAAVIGLICVAVFAMLSHVAPQRESLMVMRALLVADAFMCGGIAVFYAGYAVVMHRRFRRYEEDDRRE
jgi:uncharacterized membrane-anchored protein YjiN (DUF445 family)